MRFVYLHVIWFAPWIGFRVEPYLFGLLTRSCRWRRSLSTFVVISQNRADEKRQVLADQQWQTVQEEEQQTRSCSRSPTDPGAHQGDPRDDRGTGACRLGPASASDPSRQW
jgi:hypothetical protein